MQSSVRIPLHPVFKTLPHIQTAQRRKGPNVQLHYSRLGVCVVATFTSLLHYPALSFTSKSYFEERSLCILDSLALKCTHYMTKGLPTPLGELQWNQRRLQQCIPDRELL